MTFIFDKNIIVSPQDVSDYLVSLGNSVNRNFIFDDFKQFWPRVSELGHPAILLALHKPEIKDSMILAGLGRYYEPEDRSDMLERLCMVGDWFEAYCILALQRAGWKIISPTAGGQTEIKYGIARGHVDVLAESPDGIRYLFECKSMNSNYFRQFTKVPNDNKGYLTQLAVYDAALDHDFFPAFLCLNRDSGDVAVAEPSEHDCSTALSRVDEILGAIDKQFYPEDIDDIFEAPEPEPEIFKRKPTGRYVLPYLMKFDPLRHVLYDIVVEKNGYGNLTEYVEGYKSVSQLYKENKPCSTQND